MFKIIVVRATNVTTAVVDVVTRVSNPLNTAPDKLYCLWLDTTNVAGIDMSYNSVTNEIVVTFRSVQAKATAEAEIMVKKEHSIEKGGRFIQASIDTNKNTINVGFNPDLVLMTGGLVNANVSWSYDAATGVVTFTGLQGPMNVELIKLHSMQRKQNATADANGTITGQMEKPDILIEKGAILGIRQSIIQTNYDPVNKSISGLKANKDYISIPIHSIFRG